MEGRHVPCPALCSASRLQFRRAGITEPDRIAFAVTGFLNNPIGDRHTDIVADIAQSFAGSVKCVAHELRYVFIEAGAVQAQQLRDRRHSEAPFVRAAH
jgi:hypothetical protein